MALYMPQTFMKGLYVLDAIQCAELLRKRYFDPALGWMAATLPPLEPPPLPFDLSNSCDSCLIRHRSLYNYRVNHYAGDDDFRQLPILTAREDCVRPDFVCTLPDCLISEESKKRWGHIARSLLGPTNKLEKLKAGIANCVPTPEVDIKKEEVDFESDPQNIDGLGAESVEDTESQGEVKDRIEPIYAGFGADNVLHGEYNVLIFALMCYSEQLLQQSNTGAIAEMLATTARLQELVRLLEVLVGFESEIWAKLNAEIWPCTHSMQ